MFIYGLYSTEDDIIRYVGKTKYMLHKRLMEHINGALIRNCKTYKDNWIRSVYNKGYVVDIKLIEECDDSIWEEREKYWIKEYANLTNLTEGGEGGHGNLYDVSYEEMKEYIKEFFPQVDSKNKFYKCINKIDYKYPKNPREVYSIRGEWISWGDFLGTNRIQDNLKAIKYLSYKEAKKFLKNKGIKHITDYQKYIKDNKIDFLPYKPDRFYSNKNRGWESWLDYLGLKKRYDISEELIYRYLRRYYPHVKSSYSFRRNKKNIHHSINTNMIRGFNFDRLRNLK